MKKKFNKKLDWIAVILLLAGGLNWGLLGAFKFNLVESIFNNLSNWIYGLVGISTIWVSGRGLLGRFMKK